MIYLIPLIFFLVGCSFRSTYPTLGAVAGAGTGSLLGGPGGSAIGAGIGAIGGEAWKNKDALIEAEEKIEALSHGDVSALVNAGLEKHKSGFESFTQTIKQWLIFAAIGLAIYLIVPIFIAQRTAQVCSKKESEKLTRAPFRK